MAAFVAWYSARVTLCSASRRVSSIKMFYRWLLADGYRSDNPAARIHVRRPRAEPRPPFGVGELRALVAACPTPRDRALVLTMTATGCRPCEVLRMHTDDLDLARGLLRVHGKGLHRRWVALGHVATAALRQYLGERCGLVWLGRSGRPLTAHGIYLAVRRIADRAGVEGAFPRRFRTTFACEFLAATEDGGSLQVLMGHLKLQTSLQYAAWGRAERALTVQRRHSLGDRLG